MRLFSFKKEERILRRSEFIDLNRLGKRYPGENFVVMIRKNGRNINRLGINVSKRVGNSVQRNRVKRMIREFFRHNKQQIPKGYDILIIALEQAHKRSSLKVNEELGDLLRKHGDFFS
jgi:ribonuclease P protein component